MADQQSEVTGVEARVTLEEVRQYLKDAKEQLQFRSVDYQASVLANLIKYRRRIEVKGDEELKALWNSCWRLSGGHRKESLAV